MKWERFVLSRLLAVVSINIFIAQLSADDFATTTAAVGRSTNGLVTPVNQLVTPAGLQVELPGLRPQALALSPDGKILVTAGFTHELVAVDPATGNILQRVALPADAVQEHLAVVEGLLNADDKAQLSYTGLAFAPDGSRIYLANINGDVKVFSVASDHKITPLGAFPLPPANAKGRANDIPAGIAVSRDGKRIYVALSLSNRLVELEAASGKVLRTWAVGVAPFDVVLAGHKIYVSNWGGRRPGTNDITGPAGLGTRVRADARGISNEGSVSVIDLASGAVAMPPREIVIGPHACALAVSPNGRWLVAASASSDLLSILDTRDDEVIDTVSARQNPGDLFGAQPNALAFDAAGKILYCANGTQNAIAVFQFKPRATTLLGLIPAGWYPGALQFDAHGKKILVANIKGIAAKTQKARLGASGFGFNTKQYAGSLSLVPVPSKKELAAFTQTALANLRYPLLAQAKLPPRPDRAPAAVPERAGEASLIKHVIYIIKENRTYDQILGDVATGNGDPTLCNFGARVTPNEHRFVHDFVLLDNTYCSGILSADGHQWTDTAMATDYLEREFADFARSYPAGGFGDGGKDALAYSPAGFIWDNALAHGKTVWDFGEFTTTHKQWKDPARKSKPVAQDCYQDFVSDAHAIQITSEPDIETLRAFMEPDMPSWDLDIPDVARAARFIQRLHAFEAAGQMPNLTILWLPNDHTSGTKVNTPTPAAQVADNDLAFGQIVEAVSHSKFWSDTCIFGIEDDPQNGWDHVSGYRTTAYVISPFARHGAVVGTQYNTTSLLRTMELMLGLPPMNQMDATATPLFDCFTNTADLTAYTALTNNVPLDELNPPRKNIPDAARRHDALVSAQLNLAQPDRCPEDVLNRILWRATMGAKPYPEWAVKKTDED